MSYLGPLRLHFAGTFQAAPSTLNNDPRNYDDATFAQGNVEPGWNPFGDADFRLVGCTVRAAFGADGRPVDANDPVLGCLVADSDRQVAAKLVDLDPEQQFVSQIWGLEVRICDPAGATLVRGRFEPAAFTDLWVRAAGSSSPSDDFPLGAMYQSVLSSLEWGDVGGSAFLSGLRDSVGDGPLSIKFNVDGYDMTPTSADFTRGRIAGTIGPGSAAEPRHLVLGRQLMARGTPGTPLFSPAGGINFCVARVDRDAGKVYLDLGNALPTSTAGGPMRDLGTLSLTGGPGPSGGGAAHGATVQLGEVRYREDGWYERTAGVVELPEGRRLDRQELGLLAAGPLTLLLAGADGEARPAVTEPPGGVHVRADGFVLRLDPGAAADVRLFASRFGERAPGVRIDLALDASQLQGAPGQVGEPAGAVRFPTQLTAGPDGSVALTVEASDPGTPRGQIDGQVYGVRPLPEEATRPGADYPVNPSDFVSVRVWSGFDADEPPTWHGSIQPVLKQYANLYPVMSRFLDMSDYRSVCDHLRLLRMAFELDPDDPNSMPVTRDMSARKRQAILRWLTEVGPDGKPLLGVAPSEPALAAAPSRRQGVEPTLPPLPRGGKVAAAARRQALRGQT
jgi:hypothetical protein